MSRIDPAKISAREGWTGIAMALDPRLAMRLRQRRDERDLDDEETAACIAALKRSGISGRLHGLAIHLGDKRKRREGSGRLGAPARDELRRRLRAFYAYVEKRLARVDEERRTARVVALLILVHGLDQHGTWWGANGRTPPTGRLRVRWIAERVRDLVDEGENQYAARVAKRPQSVAPSSRNPSSSDSTATPPATSPASS